MPGYLEVQLAVVSGSSLEKLYASHETVLKNLHTLPEELTPTSPRAATKTTKNGMPYRVAPQFSVETPTFRANTRPKHPTLLLIAKTLSWNESRSKLGLPTKWELVPTALKNPVGKQNPSDQNIANPTPAAPEWFHPERDTLTAEGVMLTEG